MFAMLINQINPDRSLIICPYFKSVPGTVVYRAVFRSDQYGKSTIIILCNTIQACGGEIVIKPDPIGKNKSLSFLENHRPGAGIYKGAGIKRKTELCIGTNRKKADEANKG